jgi:STE24 endopeptidase
LIAVVVVLGFAGRFPRRWWIPAAGVFTALALLFSFVLPYVETLGTHRLRNPELRTAVRTLEQREGVARTPVLVDDVSDETTQANAISEGIGPSRRVFLWNTLLDGRFGLDEVKVVIGHELAHTARRHIWKGVAWFGLFVLPIAFVVAKVTRRRGGLRDPALVPLAALAATVIGVVATPVENLVSRRYEAEADWIALESTQTPGAARRLFARFATTSLQQPNPPTWEYVLLETHPTIMQRIAMTEAWRERHGAGAR